MRAKVKAYIANQKEHHRKRSFTEELTELLKAHNIEFDNQDLVSCPKNKLALAEGSHETRSRREEESMPSHRRRRTTKRSSVTLFRPEGWGGTAPISSLLLLDDDHASTRRHASIWAPSRSQQVLTYFWDRTLARGDYWFLTAPKLCTLMESF